jgi:heme-degrading monooxygenase HmoA
MYARLVTVQIQQGKVDEATNIYRDSVMPAAQQQKGFKGGFLLSDPNTGKGVSIALWETEDDMKASETSGYLQEQIVKFATVLAAPPTTEHFEVAIQM